MFSSGRTVIEHLLVHHSGHYLKCLLLFRKIYGYVHSLQLRVEPEVPVLIYGQRKWLSARVSIALRLTHWPASFIIEVAAVSAEEVPRQSICELNSWI